MRTHIEKKMLAYSQPEYVFKVVDPSYVPDRRISPKRFIYAFIGLIIGMIIGLILSVITRKNITLKIK